MASPLMQADRLTKSFGDRLLFADITFGLAEGDKTGIIARNGTGKTTLLRILAGRDTPDSGTVTLRSDLRVGYLEQLPPMPEGATVLDVCLGADTPVTRAVGAYRRALADGEPQAIADTAHAMDTAAAWDYEDRLTQLLQQLDITDTSAIVDTLSGGQRKRVALAAVILDDPEVLILDEPTNHLDIGVIEWLEAYLTRSRATLLMVTHDRYFLDRICTRIIELDRAEAFTYQGNYDYFLRRRAERYEAMAAEQARIRNTLRRETDWMRRQPQARAGKAKYRIDAYHELTERSRVNLSERSVSLDVASSRVGSKIFEAKGVSKSFGDKCVLRDFTYTFAPGEKIGIVGPNGVGKSTFLKMLLGQVAPDSGDWGVGQTVRFGYYSQEGTELPAGKRVIDAVTDLADDIRLNGGQLQFTPMQWLKRFLFEPAEQQKPIASLSGGERCRLQLATVLMRQPNFLILDEPTNDLDIMTLATLEDYLRDFAGCVLLVSHDRFFLDSIVDHLFVMTGQGRIIDFPGGYTEWRESERARKAAIADKPAAAAETPRQGKVRTEPRPPRLSYAERRELKAIEEELPRLGQEKADIEALFNSPTPGADIDRTSRRYSELNARIDELETRWLTLSEKA